MRKVALIAEDPVTGAHWLMLAELCARLDRIAPPEREYPVCPICGVRHGSNVPNGISYCPKADKAVRSLTDFLPWVS